MNETTASERQWTREHDALIARVAEGFAVSPLETRALPDWHGVGGDATDYWRECKGAQLGFIAISAYNTDLAAVVRASEAWRKSDPKGYWRIDSPCNNAGDLFVARFSGCQFADGETAAIALAWALYFACGGEKLSQHGA